MDVVRSRIISPLVRAGLPEGVRMGLSGTADKLTATRTAMKWQLLMALVIVYLVMAILFESFVYPALIVLSVPLATAGAVGGLAMLNLYQHQALDNAHHARVRHPHRNRQSTTRSSWCTRPCTTCAGKEWNRRTRSPPRRATASARSSCRPLPPCAGCCPSCSSPEPARSFIGDWARWWSGGSPFLPYSPSQSFPPCSRSRSRCWSASASRSRPEPRQRRARD